jgi:hypothetical protein
MSVIVLVCGLDECFQSHLKISFCCRMINSFFVCPFFLAQWHQWHWKYWWEICIVFVACIWRTEENHYKYLSQDTRYPHQDSSKALSKGTSEAIVLEVESNSSSHPLSPPQTPPPSVVEYSVVQSFCVMFCTNISGSPCCCQSSVELDSDSKAFVGLGETVWEKSLVR